MRVHTYVIATDAGSAPNYDPPFTTLAVCKPRIRKKANVGEFVMAFAGAGVNGYEPHTVVWAGVIAEKITFAEYWNDRRFARKKPGRSSTPDNFYRPDGCGKLVWMENQIHYAEQADHDLSGQFVLVFNPSWRFGGNGPPLPVEFGLRMTNGRRGERLAELSDAEWARLETWLNRQARATSVQAGKQPRCDSPKLPVKAPSSLRTKSC